jgi:hypothetical protein
MKSFSLIDTDPGMEVVPLEFARWLRVLATPPIPLNNTNAASDAEERGNGERKKQGKLYRSKGVFAVRGHSRKLLFQAVGDVMERQYVSRWDGHEQRGSKIVFIGEDLDRDTIEAGYRACLRPIPTVALSCSPRYVCFVRRGQWR